MISRDMQERECVSVGEQLSKKGDREKKARVASPSEWQHP
jgi:hypothetical protein